MSDNLNIPQIAAIFPVIPSMITARICEHHVLDKKNGSAVNGLWAYPLNAIVTVATVCLFPVGALIALVVAAVFKLIAISVDCCSSEDNDWHDAARETLGIALFDILSIAHVIAAIFRPDLDEKDWMPEITVEWRK